MRDLVRYYTREAGVRNLEREIANLARKAVRESEQKKTTKVRSPAENLEEYAGVRKYRFGEMRKEDQVGVVTGLAWTEVGGDLLTIEAVPARQGPHDGTGKLRDVMKESISAARNPMCAPLDADRHQAAVFDKRDIHVHVPEGATPKDGPSAGRDGDGDRLGADRHPIRKDIAMTGEITLRGACCRSAA
jgi:ATP-dependent Lon protease